MSSAVHIKFRDTVPLSTWSRFCRREDIQHSPNTIGGNIWYFKGDSSGVELRFGKGNLAPATNPFPPPEIGETVVVSTFFMGEAMPRVAEIAAKILRAFPGSSYSAVELEPYMKRLGDFPRTPECSYCSEEHTLEECPNRE